MKFNKFTIIVPTRNRASTVYHTLRTCLELDYSNFEVIVSDSFSQDNTKGVVDSFNDPRIKYFNTGKIVDLASNWEFGLSQVAETDFVTVLGDDDGILKDSLSQLNSILNEYQVSCVTWRKAEYSWPDHIAESFRNYMEVSLCNNFKIFKTSKVLKKAANFKFPYNMLPCIYNSVVSFDLIQTVKGCSNGKFFYGTSPDVYSAYAIACFVSNYIYSFRPFTVNGASKHSNGTGQFNTQKKYSENERIMTFYSEIEKTFNKRLVVCPSITFAIADSMLHAKDVLKERCPYNPNMRRIIELAVKETEHQDEERFEINTNAILQTGINNNLKEYTIALQRKIEWNYSPMSLKYGYANDKLAFDASKFGIQNVYDAAVFCSNLLGGNIPMPLPKLHLFLELRKRFRKILL